MTTTRTPTLAEIISDAIDNRLVELHTMLPGRIESFDATKQKADVIPMIKRLESTADGELKDDLPVIPSVPILFPRAGGFKITFPVERGDRCTLIFAERSIDNYQIGGGGERPGPPIRYEPADPDAFLMHDLSDAVALLGWYPDTETVGEVNSTMMVLGKEAGATIHIGSDSIILYGGDESTPLIKIGGDQINLYETSAADFVALAQKVLTELNKVKGHLDSLKTWADLHLHAYVDTPVGPSITGPPSLPPPPGVPNLSPSPPTPNSVAAEKVKAT